MITSLAAPGALAHRKQRRKIQNGHKGAPKWPTGSGGPILVYWVLETTFAK